jgi:hypothetical protein
MHSLSGSLVPPTVNPATCGVSSVGKLADSLFPGFRRSNGAQQVLHSDEEHDEDRFRAEIKFARIGVRARNDEFLVGCSGDDNGMHFGVSFDANAIDERIVFTVWKVLMEQLLEDENKARL